MLILLLLPKQTISIVPIDLEPLAGPLIVGGKPKHAIARSTALGVPVPDAKIHFEAVDIEGIEISGGNTGADGRALAVISARGKPGAGVLRATLGPDTGQPLSVKVPLKVEGRPAIAIEQDTRNVAIKISSKTSLAFSVNVSRSPPEGQSHTVILNQSVEPSNRGVALWRSGYPVDGWTTDSPNRFFVNETFYGVRQGTYTITTTATIKETGESDTVALVVNVGPPDTPDPLVLYTPSSSPAAIPPSSEQTPVTFRLIIAGTKTPPERLFLDEVNENGERLHTVTMLRDDGKGEDDKAGDFIYAGTAKIGSTNETQKRYLARADFFGQTVTSDSYTFRITRFPLTLEPSDLTKFVEDPKTGAKFIANEVLVIFRPGISNDRIEEIVRAENARIAGYIPTLNILKIAGIGDGTPEGARAALARFLSYDELSHAELNYEVIPAGVPGDLADCGTCGDINCQWNIYKIRADLAWLVGRGSENIAILDTGIAYDHPDLTANILREDGNVVGDDFVSSDESDHDPADESSISHGTHVAGIAAASTDNTAIGMAGISWDSKIQPVRAIPGGIAGFYDAIEYVITENKARVFNFSGGFSFDNPAASRNLFNAVDLVFDNGLFISFAAGDSGDDTAIYPAYYNIHADYEVSGTTDNGIMGVAGTNSNDELISISTYGNWVDIAAPGDNIYSTITPNTFGTLSGTSMSSPHIAGAAAFLWSLNPDWDRTQIENHLKNTAAPVSLVADQTLGGHRLDLLAAVFRDGMTYYSNDTSEANRTGEVTSGQTTFGWTTGTVDPADPVGTAQSSRDFLVAKKDGNCMAPVILEAGSNYTISTSLPAHSGDIELDSGLEEDDRLLIVTTPLFPELRVGTPFQRSDAFDNLVWHFPLFIDNWEKFPADFFVPRGDLPPCGLNTEASRTWIDIFDASDNERIYGFCALGDPATLRDKLWFAILVGETPPTQVYITATVRDTGEVYRSYPAEVPEF